MKQTRFENSKDLNLPIFVLFKKSRHINNADRYMFIGALFGFCFPALITMIICFKQAVGPIEAQIEAGLLLWVIDSAPLFLGFFGRIAGKKQDDIEALNRKLIAQEAGNSVPELNKTDAKALSRLPKLFVWVFFFLSLTPLLLNSVGIDFSSKQNFGPFVHSLLEWSALMIALLTCILAFTTYLVKNDPLVPVLGVALLCAGLMDGFHTLAAAQLIEASAPNYNLIPFTWALSRLFNSLICLAGVLVVLFRPKLSQMSGGFFVFFVSIIFIAISYVTIHLAATSDILPQTQFPNNFITRPWDVYPLIVFLITAFCFYRYNKIFPSPFSFSLLLGIIPNLAVQFHMALGSTSLFDNHFNIAHFLKIISYLAPFAGLSWSYVTSNKEKEILSKNLYDRTVQLDLSSLVSYTDRNGIITYVNDKFCEISKYKKDELIGKNHSLLNSGHHTKVFWKNVWGIISKGNMWAGAIKNRAKDGSHYWVQSTIIPKLNIKGMIIGFTSIRTDISKQKDSEQKAMDSSRLASIGELAAGVGHEINNPLAISEGNLEKVKKILLKNNAINPEIEVALGKQKTANGRIKNIVKGLRTYARTDADDQENISMRKAIDQTTHLMSEILEKENVNIERNIMDIDYLVKGSMSKIQQVIMNLITNARDATEGQEVRKINLSLEKSTSIHAVFSVTDNGCGMSDEIKSKIFDSFFTTKEIGKGTGMGLGVVAKIVNELSGEIEVETEIGKGSVFSVTLPLIEKKPVLRQQQLVTVAASRVLIVDDEEDIREILRNMLEEFGCTVEEAGNGAIAFEKIKAEKYDHVFTDMKMPVMDGPTLLKEIHGFNFSSRPVLIAVTGGVTIDFSKKGRDELFSMIDGYLLKPFDKEKIAQILNDIELSTRKTVA